jgi:hypothetical protein
MNLITLRTYAAMLESIPQHIVESRPFFTTYSQFLLGFTCRCLSKRHGIRMKKNYVLKLRSPCGYHYQRRVKVSGYFRLGVKRSGAEKCISCCACRTSFCSLDISQGWNGTIPGNSHPGSWIFHSYDYTNRFPKSR